jgi:cyanophycinase
MLTLRKRTLITLAVASAFGLAAPAHAVGHLIAVGGMHRSDNDQLFNKFIELAGGRDKAQIVVIPTASGSFGSSYRFIRDLQAYGIPADRIKLIPVTRNNFHDTKNDESVLADIDKATGLWFVGGDQQRIANALYNADGSASLMKKKIDALYRDRKGVLAGTSAGASIQGTHMPSSFGVPMDALDFGVGAKYGMRGTFIREGGAFYPGIIDQHFDNLEETVTGRHLRQAAYLIEHKLQYGVGIDTNTSMWYRPDGTIQVFGPGYLHIMDVRNAKREYNKYGSKITNLNIHMIGDGDVFNPSALLKGDNAEAFRISENFDNPADLANPTDISAVGCKQLTNAAKEQEDPKFSKGSCFAKSDIKLDDFAVPYIRNTSITPDMSAISAFSKLIGVGLVDNVTHEAVGLVQRFNPLNGYSYAYKLTFRETDKTSASFGEVRNIFKYSALNVTMDIEPVSSNLRSPETTNPVDVAKSPVKNQIDSLVFKGIFTTNDKQQFEPNRPLTRLELANAIQMSLQKDAARTAWIADADQVKAADKTNTLMQLQVVLSNTWMFPRGVKKITDPYGKTVNGLVFDPNAPVTREEFVHALRNVYVKFFAIDELDLESGAKIADVAAIDERYRDTIDQAITNGLYPLDKSGKFDPKKTVNREEAARYFAKALKLNF